MKTRVTLEIYQPHINAAAFERVKEFYPEGVKGDVISVSLPEGDPRLEGILSILRTADVEVYADPFRTRDSRSVAIDYQTTYEEEDFREVELLFITCGKYVDGGIDEDAGKLCAELRGPLKKNVPFVKVGPSSFVVNEALRKEIKKAKFQRVEFNPVFRQTASYRCGASSIEGYFQITSDLRLPPMSSLVNWVDVSGRSTKDVERRVYIVSDSRDRVLSAGWYERKDLEHLGGWDWALTFEWFGGRSIVSKRLLEFIRSRTPEVRGTPVYVD